jgi:hypothetical protein
MLYVGLISAACTHIDGALQDRNIHFFAIKPQNFPLPVLKMYIYVA